MSAVRSRSLSPANRRSTPADGRAPRSPRSPRSQPPSPVTPPERPRNLTNPPGAPRRPSPRRLLAGHQSSPGTPTERPRNLTVPPAAPRRPSRHRASQDSIPPPPAVPAPAPIRPLENLSALTQSIGNYLQGFFAALSLPPCLHSVKLFPEQPFGVLAAHFRHQVAYFAKARPGSTFLTYNAEIHENHVCVELVAVSVKTPTGHVPRRSLHQDTYIRPLGAFQSLTAFVRVFGDHWAALERSGCLTRI